jgi:hypothetical protein
MLQRFLLPLFVVVSALLLGRTTDAAAPSSSPASQGNSASVADIPNIEKVRIGFDGKYKSGYWAPVWLSLSPTGDHREAKLETVATDGDNVPVVYSTTEYLQADGSAEPVSLLRYVRVGPERGKLGAQLTAGDPSQVVWSESLRDQIPPPLAATQELFVTLGADIGLEAALKLTRRPEGQSAVGARVSSAEYLPDRWWGYEGVDWIFLSTRDGTFLDEISAEQFEALRQWVLMGGRLVLSVGSRGESVLDQDSRWKTFAPGELVEVRELRDRAGLESFTNTELPWDSEAFQRSRPMVAELTGVQGAIEFDEGGAAKSQPLAVRRTYGFGHVLFLTFDLDDPQLAAWSARPRLINNLLQRWQGPSDENARQNRQAVQHLGFEDLSGQLRAALEQFPGVTVVNIATVAVLNLAYLMLIGPIDFLLFRRSGLPAYGTWITFPLVVLGFCFAAWYMAASAHGSAIRLNQAEVIDVDFEQSIVRGTTWHHLFSPSAGQFDLKLAIDPERIEAGAKPQGWLAWQGLPGAGLGGLASQQVSLTDSPPYTVLPPGPQPGILQLPIPVASSKALAGRWWGRSELKPIATIATDEFGLPQGEIRNPFDFDLDECLLAYDEWLFRLGKIPSEGSVVVQDFPSLNLEARLTQRTVVDAKDMTTPWEQASTEVPRIMQIMLFHETARGRNYTGLTHEYLGHLDMTEHIRSGKAIFVGRSSKPISQISLENKSTNESVGETENWTWLRFVLPVDTRGDRR